MATQTKVNIIVGKVSAYENNELSFNEEVKLFQELLDTELIYTMQEPYQQRMRTLIDAGAVVLI